MIPLENTSRWPRLVSLAGRNRSSATKLARKGKPLKLVLPPVYRMSDGGELHEQEASVPDRAGAEDQLGLLGEDGR